MPMRIIVADDHEMVRAGLCSVLREQADVEVVGEAADGHQAVELARKLQPDAILLDVTMPKLNGIDAARQIAEHDPSIRIIMLSAHCDSVTTTHALRAGACAYLLKNSAAVELSLALRAAREGGTYLSPKVSQLIVTTHVKERNGIRNSVFSSLTPKQRQVLQLLAEGKTSKEVAACLFVSARTVETHRAQIMAKLNIHTMAGLIKYALREGLTPIEM